MKKSELGRNQVEQGNLDIIGDIHGYAGHLERLLLLLGYQQEGKGFRSTSGRRVLFLGDYVDRGPAIVRVLEIVRAMVESGDAIALMGNHEFNAIAYHLPNGRGGWVRSRSVEHVEQHAATLEQMSQFEPKVWQEWLEWFRQLPLFYEGEGVRASHAGWHANAVQAFRTISRLEDDLVAEMAVDETEWGQLKMGLLNGVELELPSGYYFSDKSGLRRNKIRTRWWESLQGRSYRAVCFPSSETVPDMTIPDGLPTNGASYPADAPPVFFGHYWLPKGSKLEPLASNVACLDFSVAKGGALAAYRWQGEQGLLASQFLAVE